MDKPDDAFDQGTAAGRYALHQSCRHSALTRARAASRLTIPSLVPPQGASNTTLYPTPYQGLGSRGLNSLAAKLLLAMLPPGTAFFKLALPRAVVAELSNSQDAKQQVESALSEIEAEVMAFIASSGIRTHTFEALKHLIVAGNVLVYVSPEGMMRTFPLSRYVVKRDPMGTVLEIVVEEDISPMAVPLEVAAACGVGPAKSPDDTVKIYTRIHRCHDKYEICQEINGIEVPNSCGDYPLDRLPWLALRWTAVDNDDYGRGFIEEHMGDLAALEGLSKCLLDGAAAAARVVYLLKPNSYTNKRRLVTAQNGDVVEGNKEDIAALQLDKYADFRTPFELLQQIERNLSAAFLLNSSVQRDGERVTAEEIRYMAQELETSLGGVYSVLSQEFQSPLVVLLMWVMTQQGKIPALPNDVKPQITTGLAALGRGAELTKLNTFLSELGNLGQAVGPEQVAQRLNTGNAIQRIATALGVDPKGLIKTEDQVKAEQEQAQQMAMAQQMAPAAADAALAQPQQ